jgi:GNAT superfamily N-acetyltransferase
MAVEGPCSCSIRELPEAMDLLNSVFHPGTSFMGEYYPYAYGPVNLNNMLILKEDHRIVSHVSIYPRQVYTAEGYLLKTGIIGGVATHPDYRNKGYATTLLRECIRIMERQEYDLSLLWPSVADFYRKLGWEYAAQECCFDLNAENISRISHAACIPQKSSSGYQRIHELYEHKPMRSLRQLSEYPLLINSQRRLFFEEHDGTAGYVLLGPGSDVLEYGGSVPVICRMLRGLFEQFRYSTLRVFTPPLQDGLFDFLTGLGITPRTFHLGMIRMIRLDKFQDRVQHPAENSGSWSGLSRQIFGPVDRPDQRNPIRFYLWHTEHS